MRASNRVIPLAELVQACELMGYMFEASAEFPLAASGVNDSLFIAQARPVILFSREMSYDGEGVNADVYRGAEFTAGTGSTNEINNPNDFFPDIESTVIIRTGSTITSDGTKSRATRRIFGNASNQSKGDALQSLGRPLYIPPEQITLLRITNRDSTSTQTVAPHLTWIEPDRIPGIELDSTTGGYIYKGVSI